MWEKRSYFEEFTCSDIKKLIANANPEIEKNQQNFCQGVIRKLMGGL